MIYGGTSGSGTFHFSPEGDFVKFTAMRYKGNEPDAERREWILTVDAYDTFEGIRVPSQLHVTWRLPDGDWTWMKLNVADIRYDDRAIQSFRDQ
jgi:hypothetical protein